jgi:hypothetical protein
MRELRFTLHLGADELLRWYRGAARDVFAVSDEGLRFQFPANVLQRFVTEEGVHGRFAISFDEQHRFAGIRRI